MNNEELEKFRNLWIKEVNDGKNNDDLAEESNDKAMDFYVLGVRAEKDKALDFAIKNYRMAFKMDPSVEKRYLIKDAEAKNEMALDNLVVNEASQATQITTSILEIVQKSIFLNKPVEIIVSILKWCALTDINSINKLGSVCKKLNNLIRHETIWKFMADSLLKFHQVPNLLVDVPTNVSWLNFWIHRPHLRMDGVYISKIEYLREGLPDTATRLAHLSTVHIVTYYRYFRFFPNSRCVVLTTPRIPADVVSKLDFDCKLEGFHPGVFDWIDGNIVSIDWKGKRDRFNAILCVKRNKLTWGISALF